MSKVLTPHRQDRSRQRLSQWVTLLEDRVRWSSEGPVEAYHALEQPDYVTVLALTGDGRLPVVRQYRPVLERVSFELPGGLAEPDEPPHVTALRELEEETGWTTRVPLVALGSVTVDTGRLGNLLHCYFARALERIAAWEPEPGVEATTVSLGEFRRLVLEDQVLSALHLGLVGLALMRGVRALDGLLGE
jgi:ADP-ribose pyrophosphatase